MNLSISKCSQLNLFLASSYHFFAAAIIEFLEEVGPEKFCSVFTDNAPILQEAWKKICEKFPHISSFGCVAQVLSLPLKDILNPYENVLFEVNVVNESSLTSLIIITVLELFSMKLVSVPTRWYSQH